MEKACSSLCWFTSQLPATPDMGQSNHRNLELHLNFPRVWQGLSCSPRNFSRKLDERWSIWVSGLHTAMGCGCSKQWLYVLHSSTHYFLNLFSPVICKHFLKIGWCFSSCCLKSLWCHPMWLWWSWTFWVWPLRTAWSLSVSSHAALMSLQDITTFYDRLIYVTLPVFFCELSRDCFHLCFSQ